MATVVDPRVALLSLALVVADGKDAASFVSPPLSTSLSAGGCSWPLSRAGGQPVGRLLRAVSQLAVASDNAHFTAIVGQWRAIRSPVNHLSVFPPVVHRQLVPALLSRSLLFSFRRTRPRPRQSKRLLPVRPIPYQSCFRSLHMNEMNSFAPGESCVTRLVVATTTAPSFSRKGAPAGDDATAQALRVTDGQRRLIAVR
jgi:hypothetical protein